MSNPNIKAETMEYIAEQKLKWLHEFGLSFGDVLVDEEGEYVLHEIEGEGGIVESTKKVYLPDFSLELE